MSITHLKPLKRDNPFLVTTHLERSPSWILFCPKQSFPNWNCSDLKRLAGSNLKGSSNWSDFLIQHKLPTFPCLFYLLTHLQIWNRWKQLLDLKVKSKSELLGQERRFSSLFLLLFLQNRAIPHFESTSCDGTVRKKYWVDLGKTIFKTE